MKSSVSTVTVTGHAATAASGVLMRPPIPGVLAVGFFGGMLSYLYYKSSYPRAPTAVAAILQATKDYNRELDRVIEDRNNIILAIKDLHQRSKVLEDRNDVRRSVESLSKKVNHQLPHPERGSNSYRLFFEGDRSLRSLHSEKEKIAREETSDIFVQLLFSYPKFDEARENDPNYVRVAHKELVEHHLLVLACKNQYFDSVYKVLNMCEKNEMKNEIGTPDLGKRNN